MSDEKLYYNVWPENVPKAIEIPKIRLDKLLKDASEKYPDSTATTYFNVPLSYKKLDEIADRIATKLVELGIKKGDVVALHFTNTPSCVASYFGVLRAGGTVTLLSPLFKTLEIKHQLNDSKAKILIVWEGFDQLDDPVIPQTKVQKVIYSSLGPWFSPDPTIPEEEQQGEKSKLFLEDIIQHTEPNPPKIDIDPEEDLACLQYTGGTTGLPKGAMLTHYSMVANLFQMLSWFPEVEYGNEVMLVALPLYHIYAQSVAMNFSVIMGANMVLISNPRNVEELIEGITEHRVTLFPGVAALYNFINNHPGVEELDLSCIKYCLSGAGPLPLEIQQRFENLTGAKLREGYGLTEASPVTHANQLVGKFKNGTIGIPLPSTEMKIVDINDPDKILGLNEVGELCIKGPQVMKGYYNKPEATQSAIHNGWLHTGDMALMDEEGYTVIKSRLKNLIKYKGHSVFPDEVEDFLFQNEAILDCAIIGEPDPAIGENIVGFVVLKDEYVGKVSEQDIIDWAKDNMASYKYPRRVKFLKEIPKTNTGKTLHRLLREGTYEI